MKKQSRKTSNTHKHFYYKVFAILFLIHLITPNLFAQGKLVNGYIITNQNDTIRGLVKDEGWTKSPDAIEFKTNNGALNKISAVDLKGFGIYSTNEVYKSKKIGLLDITLRQVYIANPSLETKDSVRLFLQEIVSGNRASLYEYLNAAEQSHYFIEKGDLLKELLNYPFHRLVDNKTHLLVSDTYKNQLVRLCADASNFNVSIPLYQIKYLKEYIEEYNKSFLLHDKIYQADDNKITLDLDVNMGLENWNETPIVINNKFTLGVGLRVNFPRKFHNRFVKLSYFITPNVLKAYDQGAKQIIPLKTIEFAVGSYIGAGAVRPYVGFHYSGAYHGYRMDFLGIQAGISYKRRFNIEIGHFANFNSIILESPFFTPPRISLHYMINLNFKRRRAS